jgi:hypothetical protein
MKSACCRKILIPCLAFVFSLSRTVASEFQSGWSQHFIYEYEDFDSWLTGTIKFKHDKNGLINRGSFESKEGYTADISFDHDVHGNITRIHWDFSFGKTQTYSFEYKRIR